MKYLLIFTIGLLAFTNHAMTQSYGITFDHRNVDLGKVKKGEIKEFEYTFFNSGTEDISIAVVSACECSTLDWPTQDIKPGEIGKIKVIFDSGKKEESEEVMVDMYLNNIDPKIDAQRAELLTFKFELVQ
ncbi:MAG TPA: DUF1573 domain-containing protein [Saprospiraceae bacterium]|nr:DUF1573 domain-containing protein [Saprospiraceae bacterium]MCB9327813.1 DUF1573 domain-containing protein [Lewinellaceae bacterium]HPK10248.1 DUF1573 domain-containing protein [Saprospiraceae bacterium]HPQ22276.1 DUF1573 domain-containing protein [Saprospiraceae bacterium]HRX27848.1 DUF1573 domain-containing protein [Saprospiraceae bacterium]